MTLIRTIQSPGVEIREIDKSQYASTVQGTYCLVNGYADKGQEHNPLIISSVSDLIANFGEPTNEAERYFYYTGAEVINKGGTLVANKLPYNNTISTKYKYYGVTLTTGPISGTIHSEIYPLTGTTYGYTDFNEISVPVLDDMTVAEYDTLLTDGTFPTDASSYNWMIVDTNKSRINSSNEGIAVVIVDPVKAMYLQRIMPNPADSDIMSVITGISYPSGITSGDFADVFTNTFVNDSISETIMRLFPTIEYTNSGETVDSEYSQFVGIVVCNIYSDSNSEGKLRMAPVEYHTGSIIPTHLNKTTGQSDYIVNLVNANSNYIKMFKNSVLSYPSESSTTIVYKSTSTYPMIGFVDSECEKVIQGGSIVTELVKGLNKVSNIDDVQLDVVIDAGLSTIAQFTGGTTEAVSGAIFDPVNDTDAEDTEITSASAISNWRAVANALISFCSDTRKDCMAIIDVPRNLVLEGNQKFIRTTSPDNTFSNKIGNKLKYVTGLNSSYAALYGDWMKMVDSYSGISFWIPPTVKMSGIYCYNDTTANIFDAPAGLNRGVISGISDLAFNPNIKEADQLYIKSINYAKSYPLDGFIAEGQKTTQVKASAFDRVNVRRLFLRLERLVYSVSRYFVMEPNNLFTRKRLVDVIEPTFKAYKAAGGIYDYRIVCDDTNNTASVIDNNEIRVAILIKPVKTAEFILVSFVATRTDANFEEVLQGL